MIYAEDLDYRADRAAQEQDHYRLQSEVADRIARELHITDAMWVSDCVSLMPDRVLADPYLSTAHAAAEWAETQRLEAEDYARDMDEAGRRAEELARRLIQIVMAADITRMDLDPATRGDDLAKRRKEDGF
jgi:hypothetical protein